MPPTSNLVTEVVLFSENPKCRKMKEQFAEIGRISTKFSISDLNDGDQISNQMKDFGGRNSTRLAPHPEYGLALDDNLARMIKQKKASDMQLLSKH